VKAQKNMVRKLEMGLQVFFTDVSGPMVQRSLSEIVENKQGASLA
jgi:hypothetical protein